MPNEDTPPTVPEAKQGGETWERFPWVERAAWTERMLTALEDGVKGGVWFSLIDKVLSKRNLLAAATKVLSKGGAAGIDRQSTHQFLKDLDHNLERLAKELADQSYHPRAVMRHYIPKPGTKKKRPLGIPAVRDRVVQQALRQVLEPIFEIDFVEHSYGFRPQRGCKDALRRVQDLLNEGHCWVVDADFSSFFDTLDHDILMTEIETKVADGRVIRLLWKFLQQSVMEDCKEWNPIKGTPQGAVISPLLANIYLHPVDMALQSKGMHFVRYADDLVMMCRSEEEATAALQLLHRLAEERGLQLHPEKTMIVDATQKGGFDFLGYHFERGSRWPRRKSMKALRERLKPATRRANGHGLDFIIRRINPILRGWYAYFKHSRASAMTDVDGWVRRRLRGILRKREKRRGIARGADNRRWTIAYFRQQGLFSLTDARAAECQS